MVWDGGQVKGRSTSSWGGSWKTASIDHIRREKKIVRPDSEAGAPAEQAGYHPHLTEDLALKTFETGLLKLVKGRQDEQELGDFILAASLTTSDGKVNEQLAEV